MLSFRKKIFLIDCLLTLVLVAFLFYFSESIIDFFFKEEKKSFKVLFLIVPLIIHRVLGTLIITLILKPIQRIFKALRSFEKGKEELLPPIVIKAAKEGEFSKLASILNALTKRIQRQIKNLTKQREETKKILESIGEGIIALDLNARITFVNPIAMHFLKISAHQVLGKKLIEIQKSDLIMACHEQILLALNSLKSHRRIWKVQEKKDLFLELISAPLAHREGALLVLQDKSFSYKMVQIGKDFIANASHELRTPITIIRGFAETLQDVPNLSRKMQREIIEKIVRTCSRLSKLVRSLLTLADIENLSEERLKKMNLIPLIENCIHFIKTANPKIEIVMHSKFENMSIVADADLLELAILNVLENSVKYSANSVHLSIFVTKKNKEVYLVLKDRGIGIPQADLTRIFDRFYTVDKARSRKSGGAGLGLSIVKTIIEKHKGKIRAQSQPGKGSTFTFILPLTSSST